MPGIQIIGGGNNRVAEVDDKGRLKVFSVTIEPEYFANNEGNSFQLQLTVTPSPSADFLYIKNLSEDPLVLENLFVTCDSRENIWIYRNPTGTPTDGSEIDPVNSNFGSSRKAEGTFIYGEDLGGLTAGTLFNTLPCFSDSNNTFTFRNWIILTKNSTILFNARVGDIELDISIPFFYLVGDL